jgi:RNA polymerase sigma factor (sigma-70 family)
MADDPATMEASAARPPASVPRAGFVSARLLRVASDERLVDLVREGSQPAFEVLYDRHHRGILAFCRHMLASREEAEDAVQHTFMAAYRDLVGSEKEIQLRAWLYAIARNRCLSVLRARRERPVDELEDIPTEGLAAEVQRRADLQAMLRDLAALPEEQRAALVLAELGDLPHDEIAAVVGCRKEKVKALVFQARSSLHASRDARDADCAEMRELLSTLRGGALRRTTLRRHLKDCAGCRAFRDDVERQRRAMALLLPVAPTLGLKAHVLSSAFGTGSAVGAAGVVASAGGTAAGLGAATGAGATATSVAGGGAVLAAKALVVAVALGGGAYGVESVASHGSAARDGAAPGAINRSGGHDGAGGSSGSGGSGSGAGAAAGSGDRTSQPGASDSARGHTDRGKQFARTRGKGHKRGLEGTQPGQTGDHPASGGKAGGGSSANKGGGAGKAGGTHPATDKPKTKAKVHATPTPKPARTPAATPPPKPVRTPRPAKTPEPTPDATAAPTDEAPALPTPGMTVHGRG